MDYMIAVEDFKKLCDERNKVQVYAEENRKKFELADYYSVESGVSRNIVFAGLTYACVCLLSYIDLPGAIGSLEMNGTTFSVATIMSWFKNELLDKFTSKRKKYNSFTLARTWSDKIFERFYYKTEEVKAMKKYEAYSKAIEKLGEEDFECDFDDNLINRTALEEEIKELEEEAVTAEKKVGLCASKVALVEQFGKQINWIEPLLEIGGSMIVSGFLGGIGIGAIGYLIDGNYATDPNFGADVITAASITGVLTGIYQVTKQIKRKSAYKSFSKNLNLNGVSYDERKSIYSDCEDAVEKMADSHVNLLRYKGLLKTIDNSEELGKSFIKI